MRRLLDPSKIDPALEKQIGEHGDAVDEVEKAIAAHPVVVVGMAQNPFVRRARRALADAGIAFEYIEYGSYLGEWRRRLAIKRWSGFPTFPQVFVKGTLIGGAREVQSAIADGSLKSRLTG